MILDHLNNASFYSRLSPKIEQGFAWLEKFDLSVPIGRHEIEGDEIYAMVQSYDTAPADEKKFEAHRQYLDLQYMAQGAETVLFTPRNLLGEATAFSEAKDYWLYADPTSPAVPFVLNSGSFAVFYPQDGHKPGCIYSSVMRVRKVVVKIRL